MFEIRPTLKQRNAASSSITASRRGTFWKGLCAVSLGFLAGCGGYAEDETEWVEYGESEQALRRSELEDVDAPAPRPASKPTSAKPTSVPTSNTTAPPPPPPPTTDPKGCPIDTAGDMLAALGYRVLLNFGRTDAGVWECVPGVSGCTRVRLSSALRATATTPEAQAKVAQVESMLSYFDDPAAGGAMARLAQAYRDTGCNNQTCPAQRPVMSFRPHAIDECGYSVIAIEPIASHLGDIGNMGTVNALAQATPSGSSGGNTGAGVTFAFSQIATVYTAATAAPAPAVPPPPSTVMRGTLPIGGYLSLYGGERPCAYDDDIVCVKDGVNVIVKTYMDPSCDSAERGPDGSCHHPLFDTVGFKHYFTGFGGAVKERINEGCERATGTGSVQDGVSIRSNGEGRLATCRQP